MESSALITNDAVVLGLLAATLGGIFYTAKNQIPAFRTFYRYVPVILLCYFIPSLYNTFGLVDAEASNLYFVSSRFLLPATLVLLTLSIDLPGITRLGPKALIMFATGTLSIIVGGPLAILFFSVKGGAKLDYRGGGKLDHPAVEWRG